MGLEISKALLSQETLEPDAIRRILKGLGAGASSSARAATIEALARIGVPEQAEPVVGAALVSVHSAHREAAAHILGHWSLGAGGCERLEAAFVSEIDPNIRESFGVALEKVRVDWGGLIEAFEPWTAGDDRAVSIWPSRRAVLAELRSSMEGFSLSRWHLDWLQKLGARHWSEPMAMVAALKLGSVFGREHFYTEVYLQRLLDIYGEVLEAPARALLLHDPLADHVPLYLWMCGRGAVGFEGHLKALEEGSPEARDHAVRGLARIGLDGAMMGRLCALLGAEEAALRCSTARCLELLGGEGALGALKAALGKEREDKVRRALQEAIGACDPVERRVRAAAFGRPGIYRRAEGFSVNRGLEQLRALRYGEADEISWVQLCDLVERFRSAGALQVALDYFEGHEVGHWPEAIRLRPWGWDDEPALARLAPLVTTRQAGGRLWWVPVHVLETPRGEGFLAAGLAELEPAGSMRPFCRSDVVAFGRWVERGWFWCRRQQMPLPSLEVRADGGAVSHGDVASGPATTSLDLWRCFGARLTRGRARVESVRRGHGVQARVRIPSGHKLRDVFGLPNKTRHLDLCEVLVDEIEGDSLSPEDAPLVSLQRRSKRQRIQ